MACIIAMHFSSPFLFFLIFVFHLGFLLCVLADLPVERGEHQSMGSGGEVTLKIV